MHACETFASSVRPLCRRINPYVFLSICAGEGGSQDDDDGDDDVDADREAAVDADGDGPAGQPAAMSVGQRTGLAKLPNVLEWLRHALGSTSGRATAGQAAAQEALPKFLVFAHHKSVSAPPLLTNIEITITKKLIQSNPDQPWVFVVSILKTTQNSHMLQQNIRSES